jgi:ubiquinone/menaquinone biosynthesis C-methylase UbiE
VSFSIPDSIELLPTREGYDRWATIYDVDDNPLIALEQPRVDSLLGDVRGLRVVDIGCGTGRHTVRLLRAGALVTAIDFSEEMLNRAQCKVEPSQRLDVQFVQHDLAQPLPLESASVDRVLCGLVLDHIPGLDLLFGEMRRICKLDGAVVISVMHPAMMLKGVQARFTDPQTGRETRPVSCPHQISDYVMAAARTGLRIDHISEHLVDPALADKCPRAQKHLGWPLLLLMRLLP